MITPRFRIEQSDDDILFIIQAPHASLSEADIYADLDLFCFYASPYYLRLHLPGHIVETDGSKGSYDIDTGVFKICVQKVNRGEHFQNLDLITSLLTPSTSKKPNINKTKVEVLRNDGESVGESEGEEEDEWYIDQFPVEEPPEDILITAPKYGFGNKVCGVFSNFSTEFADVIEVPQPDTTSLNDRTRLRIEHENSAFSEEHYLADWAQPEEISSILNFKPSWQDGFDVKLSDEELDVMKDLPKKEILLDLKEEHGVLFSLVDIIFAFSYNVRTTLGENTVESAWTINKLSATLSWLQSFSSLKEAIVASVRRSLSFPLYRHWDVSMAVLKDVQDILKLGKRQILKSFLEMHSLFNYSEPRYILNQLYIRDYLIWIQQIPDNRIKALSKACCEVVLQKSDVGLDLEELECAALIVQNEELTLTDVSTSCKKAYNQPVDEQLAEKVSRLKLQEACGNDISNSSSGTSDDQSDSDDESDSSSSSILDSDDLSSSCEDC